MRGIFRLLLWYVRGFCIEERVLSRIKLAPSGKPPYFAAMAYISAVVYRKHFYWFLDRDESSFGARNGLQLGKFRSFHQDVLLKGRKISMTLMGNICCISKNNSENDLNEFRDWQNCLLLKVYSTVCCLQLLFGSHFASLYSIRLSSATKASQAVSILFLNPLQGHSF